MKRSIFIWERGYLFQQLTSREKILGGKGEGERFPFISKHVAEERGLSRKSQTFLPLPLLRPLSPIALKGKTEGEGGDKEKREGWGLLAWP